MNSNRGVCVAERRMDRAAKVLHSLSHLVEGDRSFFLREMPYYEIPAQHLVSGLDKEVFAEAFLLPS